MAVQFADRMFISVNGAKIADVQSASLKRNRNAKVVNSMTQDPYNVGFVQGNWEFDVEVSIAVRNTLARPKLETINYALSDVQLTVQVGADQFVATGLFLKNTDDDAGGIGEEAKTKFSFGALKVSDAIGNSALFQLNLG